MLRLVLLTVGTWTALSFLFTWLWGTAISRVSDPAGYEFRADPTAAGPIAETPPEGGTPTHLADESFTAMATRPLGLTVQRSSEVTQYASMG